ncbi:MAG: dTDP-4-dehydrorhamnose 3,5-epimerase [Bacteroidota bacterium]|nr:dTDP-4-dehydrorhamnose 3,5-epimerase [Bacteroidota bacterium]MDP4226148.1 dTDP-4-dehydrorhamnose 3,5-epimerase [Bacteroidota bacterium]MDP4272711.1 dTDP-4-dehydrorhamnose 3,5-epimerase [Bacteroidota bacterium]
MKIIKTEIPDVLIIEPKVFEDERGYFYESYNEKALAEEGLNYKFVQDNQSKSSYGVLRGLHYQLAPYSQTKLVRILEGRVFDVAVDLRKGSPSFGKWIKVELSAENKRQLIIPRGFAHGFSVLSPTAVFFYKVDNLYTPKAERGILYSDKKLNIDWGLEGIKPLVAAKDNVLPPFDEAEINFIYGQL